MKKKEIWITVAIAVIAAAAILIVSLLRAQNKANIDAEASSSASTDTQMPSETAVGQWVAVIHGSEAELWFDSGVDDTYTVTGDYGTMTIEVKDEKWHVSSVECPNHNCENMGWDDGSKMIPITCIPNNIIICTYDVAQNYLGGNS